MKKLVPVYIIVALILVIYTYQNNRNPSPTNNNRSYPYPWLSHQLIAHAFGGIDGKTYTNSLEAFETNYRKGFRLFEADLVLTSDGYMVAKHGWDDNPERKPLTLQQFKSTQIPGGYTPMDFEQIAHLMNTYKDVYLITDTKAFDTVTVKKQFKIIVDTARKVNPAILDRIIPQIYNEEMLPAVLELYKFESVIYTLYQTNASDEQVIEFATKNRIGVITMSNERYSKEFVDNLAAHGIYSYVHTINDISRITELLEEGVQGFYTDFVDPESL